MKWVETAESDTVGGGSEAHSSHAGSLSGGERGALHREAVVAASVRAERQDGYSRGVRAAANGRD